MNKETFLRIFGGIDDTYIQRANEDVNLWQKSQEGVVVRPDGSRRSPWRAVIASVACAAVVIGVFVFLLKVGRIDITSSSEKLSSVRISFEVEYWESPKQYGEFTASRDTVSVSFNLYIYSSALVEFHRDSYDGPVDASLIIPCPDKFRPDNLYATETTSLDVQKGVEYYVTVSSYDDWSETAGSITIRY